MIRIHKSKYLDDSDDRRGQSSAKDTSEKKPRDKSRTRTIFARKKSTVSWWFSDAYSSYLGFPSLFLTTHALLPCFTSNPVFGLMDGLMERWLGVVFCFLFQPAAWMRFGWLSFFYHRARATRRSGLFVCHTFTFRPSVVVFSWLDSMTWNWVDLYPIFDFIRGSLISKGSEFHGKGKGGKGKDNYLTSLPYHLPFELCLGLFVYFYLYYYLLLLLLSPNHQLIPVLCCTILYYTILLTFVASLVNLAESIQKRESVFDRWRWSWCPVFKIIGILWPLTKIFTCST